MRPILALALILSLATTTEAGFRKNRLLAGPQAAEQAARTLQLSWTTNLDDALARAKQQNRLVFWVHMLGKIDGPT